MQTSGPDVFVYVHVDDFGVQADNDEAVDQVAGLIKQASDEAGLPAKLKRAGTVDQYV